MQFVLHDVLKISEKDIPGYDELDRDFTNAILEEAGKLATGVLAPLNSTGDKEGCTLENGVVRTPKGFKDAYDQMKEGGWIGLDCDPEFGGQGMPYLMNSAVGELFVSSNMAFNMYQGLSHGAISAIYTHGTDAQKATYLPNMVEGSWSGTMNLTEPHCGTDLGLIRTKAEPQDNGSYKISGQKIWISAGEHDLTDNIIHLVLAKIPGGPEGVKGISLFIVPKFMVNDDGSLGDRNSLSCGGLEEKMGIHGNATCVMNYDGATGYLIGDMHKGMRAMFTMMNEARLGVGTNGIQSLDLVGRKLGLNGGKTVMGFFEMVKTFIKENEGHEALNAGFLTQLKQASKDLQAAGMYFMQNGMKNPNNALSGSYDFMHLFGHVCLGLVWAQMAKASYAALEGGTSDPDFYETKIATGKYYMARHLPATAMHLARIETGADTVMDLAADHF
ncbi:UNVERIFIED_CONTAM: hypothetical protein GTU68_049135 [Idotea baltica]|nr:hypothetical protein [Idotea baltica]